MFMTIALVFWGVGSLVSLVSSVMMLVAGFSTGVGWGLAMLFLPGIPQLIYLFKHWETAKRPFQVGILGVLFTLCGGLFAHYAVKYHEVDSIPRSLLEHLPENAEVTQQAWALLYGTNAPAGSGPDGSAGADDASIGNDVEDMVGKEISYVIEKLGHPRAKLKTGEFTIMQYPEIEIEAGPDGIVRRQFRRGGE